MVKRVVFLHRKGLGGSGSKIMRCDQLAAICRQYLGDEYRFDVVAQRPIRNPVALVKSCRALRDCVVVLLKGTAAQFGEEGMELLRHHARGVCIDYVDADVEAAFSSRADVHIGASHAGCRLLGDVLARAGSAGAQAKVMHLTHHADPRLAGVRCRQGQAVRVGYLGNPANLYLPAAARRKVEVLQYTRDADIAEVFDALRDFNIHYCVRALAPDVDRKRMAKPFTKGFTAAAMGAHVMTARDTDDALHYLGADYPFLLESAEDSAIVNALDRAEAMFGTSAWAEAEERLAYLREMSSPRRVAEEMNDILELFD